VGFRQSVCWLAADRLVTGYVQNLPDGRVLLVAEGRIAEVEGLLADVHSTMDRHIAGVETRRAEATGEFETFGIRS
jgi:acylphosphatase